MRVLIVEDDQDLLDIVERGLTKAGLVVDCADNAEDALEIVELESAIDVVVMDIGLPDMNGDELLLKIKKVKKSLPVMALTGRDSEDDVVSGITTGFDDYMTKPFLIAELVARIQVLYRSFVKTKVNNEVAIANLKIDLSARNVYKYGAKIKLTTKEYALLLLLAQNKEQELATQNILSKIWDRNTDDSRSRLATTVSRLRRKVEDAGVIIEWAGRGYKIYETETK